MKKAFALILVLIFTAIILMVVSSIALSLVSGLKLNRQSQNMAETYGLARGGIDDALNELRMNTIELNVNVPSTNCTDEKYKIYYFDSTNGIYQPYGTDYTSADIVSVFMPANPNADKDGFYAYRMCNQSGENMIYSIGFINGKKMTLNAIITHDPADDNPSINHLNDTVKIYQVGS